MLIELCRIATFLGEAEALTDVLEDVLKSFVEVCIDVIRTHAVCAFSSFLSPFIIKRWYFIYTCTF